MRDSRTALALLFFAAMGGCEFNCQVGGISKEKVEAAIREKIAAQVSEEFKVTCPAIVKDATTACSVVMDGGQTFTVDVTSKGGSVDYESKGVAFGKLLGPKLRDGMKSELSLELDEVSCPPVLLAHDGAEGLCQGKAKDLAVPIALRFDKKGEYNFQPTGGVIVTQKAEELVVGRFKAQNIEAKVSCGPQPFRLSVPGATFECQASDATGKSIPIYFRVTSATGDVDMGTEPFAP